VVIPAIRPLAGWLNSELGWIPFFSTSLSGPGLLPASLVLAIMILPTIAAVSQDALTAVPMKTKQAAYGMGTTHWEAILKVMVPTAATGIFGSLVLGLGRALGETMALAMLVGNSNQIALSVFAPANTLAALLALNFPEAGPNEVEVLMYAALILMLITLIVNVIGSMIMLYAQRGTK
jgi:phosphate transport system permease protein